MIEFVIIERHILEGVDVADAKDLLALLEEIPGQHRDRLSRN
jgi:hypothetical protein